MAERKPLRDDTEARVQLLLGLVSEVPAELRADALREVAERLAAIHERHGPGEPEWLVRVRAMLG